MLAGYQSRVGCLEHFGRTLCEENEPSRSLKADRQVDCIASYDAAAICEEEYGVDEARGIGGAMFREGQRVGSDELQGVLVGELAEDRRMGRKHCELNGAVSRLSGGGGER